MNKTDDQIKTPKKQRETMPKNPNEAHKNNLKEEILQVINKNFIEMILDMVNHMYRRHSRNSKTTKIRI
jgi:hypothetical protein